MNHGVTHRDEYSVANCEMTSLPVTCLLDSVANPAIHLRYVGNIAFEGGQGFCAEVFVQLGSLFLSRAHGLSYPSLFLLMSGRMTWNRFSFLGTL